MGADTDLYSGLQSALAGWRAPVARRFRHDGSGHDRWFVVKDGRLVRFTVEVRDRRPDPCVVCVAAPVHPSPSCTAESAPGGWWVRMFAVAPRWKGDLDAVVARSPREAALCAVAAGFLMASELDLDGRLTCRLDGGEVEALVRRQVAALLPRKAYALASDVEACVREVMGLDVAEALARVRKDAELLADRVGEDEWLSLYREAVARKVHGS